MFGILAATALQNQLRDTTIVRLQVPTLLLAVEKRALLLTISVPHTSHRRSEGVSAGD